MKARLDRKTKILTAAVLCACTTLWASPVWAASGGSATNGAYYGGRSTSASGKVEGKNVTIEAGDNFKGVYGGYAFEEKMGWGSNEPILSKENPNNEDEMIPGKSQANNNKVIINGGTVNSGLLMGDSRNPFYGSIAGAWSNYASGNEVEMNDGTFIGQSVSLGEMRPGVYGGIVLVNDNKSEDHPDIINNSVYIGNATIDGGNVAGVYVDALKAAGKNSNNNNVIKNNSVIIDGAIIQSTSNLSGNIYGAYSIDNNSILDGNTVTIKSGEITSSSAEYGGGIYGAWADREGSITNNNTVIIEGGEINANIYGAYGYLVNNEDSDKNDDIDDSVITGNKVIITGGKIIGNVYAANTRQSKGALKNNGVEVSGNADLSQAGLHGSKFAQSNTEGQYLLADNYQGSIKEIDNFNIVNVLNGSEVTVLNNIDLDDGYTYGDINIQNSSLDAKKITGVKKVDVINSELITEALNYFDYLNIDNDNQKTVNLGKVQGWDDGFVSNIKTDTKLTASSIEVPVNISVDMENITWETGGVVIDVENEANFEDNSIGTTGTLSVTGNLAVAADTEIQDGDRMSLIKAGSLNGIEAKDVNDTTTLQIGFASEAKVELQDGDNSIDWVVTGAKQATEQVSIIGESRTAAIAFVNQGSDILNNAFGLMDDGKYGIKTFAAAHGNYSKYETGSHIRVNGWSMLAGVGSSEKVNDGTFSWGVFFENGSGNYRTYNDYNGFNLEGFGSAVYNGGGALARYRSNAGNYAEVGVRAGMLKNSLSNAVADGFGVQGGYDEDTTYYGAHVGAGHIFTLDDHSSLDVYGKYFYTHHDSDEFEILGDEVRFDSADSSRLRLGMRYNQNDGNAFSHYYGLAWDYEFNGDADVTAAGFDTGNPSLKGSTAVIEAGIHYAPDKSPWSVDLGLQGYGGQRDGFSGTMQVNYSF